MVELSRRDGVTIFISTHFMNEAQRCDRISLMHAGKVLASDISDERCASAVCRPGSDLHRLLEGSRGCRFASATG